MADIFISYARADRAFVEPLAIALEVEGYTVWWDRQMVGGAQFAQSIEEELNKAAAVIVVWSPASLDSRWVKDEAVTAADAGKLIPIAIAGAAAPLGFKQFHLVEMEGWGGERGAPAFADLLRALPAHEGERPDVAAATDVAEEDEDAAGAPSFSQFLRPSLLASYGALALAVIVAFIVLTRPSPQAPQQTAPAAQERQAGQTQTTPTLAARRTPADQPLTIAVMPFVNMSDDPANAYFADGISEEILNALARIKGLDVTSRTSSFALRGADITATEIGARLNADLLLEGSVRKAGKRVRVTAQLIETVHGTHLWSQVYERRLDDLFGVQDDVTKEIVEALPGLIGIKPLAAPARAESAPVDPEAYRLYLEASFAINQGRTAHQKGEDDLAYEYGEKADRLVKQALDLDPNLAGAWSLLAEIVRQRATREYEAAYPTFVDALQAASAYWDKALALDPNAVEVLLGQAMLASRYQWRWEEGTRLYERAIEADPNSADAQTNYAYHLSKIGRCVEALAHAKRGVALDSSTTWRQLSIPRILPCLGRTQEAEKLYADLLKKYDTNAFVIRDMFLIHFMDRDLAGLKQYRKMVEEIDWPDDNQTQIERRNYWLHFVDAAIKAYSGDKKPFLALVDAEVAKHDAAVEAGEDVDLRFDGLWIWSVYYAFMGETQKALDLYERAIAAETLYLPQNYPYSVYEFTEEMRNSPRYRAIWETRPELVELKKLRLEALKDKQFYGVLPDGTVVTPDAGE